MSLCILGLGQQIVLPALVVSLGWTHSVEGTRWEETWRVGDNRIEIIGARIKGSGAGMEVPPGAVLIDGWWEYRPATAPLRQVVLAASGATRGGWTLCWRGGCRLLGAEPGPPITLRPCT